ncbi:MAG: hypothetical protein FWE24_11695 [Defluviitaleaceae bacterium]|nr:hypothetical protein [Defluviitaleaceae bacterium]
MFRGLGQMVSFSPYFQKMMLYVKGMGIYSAVIYVMDLSGISAWLPMPVTLLLALVMTVVSLYVSYSIIMGIRDIEMDRSLNLNCAQLYFAWRMLAVFSVLPFLTVFIPLLAFIAIIVGFGVGVYYIYAFYNTKTLFYRNNITYSK